MAIFQVNGNKAIKLDASTFEKEKTLQNLFEGNLDELLDMEFVHTEYPTSFAGRIDTLAIDADGAPVIIEYKKTQNDNVINQGLSYLRWLLDHKADFEKLCAQKGIKAKVSWEFPRVICIAEAFNRFDLDTVAMLPVKIELLRYSFYEGGLLILEPVAYLKGETGGIRRLGAKSVGMKATKMQATFSLDYHLKKGEKEIAKLFMALREKIKAIDEEIIEEPKALYVAYKKATNFADVVVLKKSLLIFLNVASGKLDDPRKIARDLRKPKLIGHWGNGDYSVKIQNENELNEAFGLILQSYQKNK